MGGEWTFGRPGDREAVRKWVEDVWGVKLPERGRCRAHDTPLDYLCHAFFEEGNDCVVWACRGGGKTLMGAIATMLDLVYKPGTQVRILGGSLDQSDKMYRYLLGTMELYDGLIKGKPGRRGFSLVNGSRVEILPQSQKAVRGLRVQKVRCDELEMFSREVWDAVGLVTRSLPPAAGGAGAEGAERPAPVKGSVEAFSTMHVPGGLMSEVVEQAHRNGRRVFKWCVWDVCEQCEQADCAACPVRGECRGRARHGAGFLQMADLLAMRARVAEAVWQREMLCGEPRAEGAVFEAFTRAAHVKTVPPAELAGARRVWGIDFGFAGSFACVRLAILGDRVHVEGETVMTRARLDTCVGAVLAATGGKLPEVCHVDPAGVAVNAQTGLSDVRVLREKGLQVRFRPSPVISGIGEIERLLKAGDGTVRLTIDPSCRSLIAAMGAYAWDDAWRARKDGVHDHPIDALRYAVWGEFHGDEGKRGRKY